MNSFLHDELGWLAAASFPPLRKSLITSPNRELDRLG